MKPRYDGPVEVRCHVLDRRGEYERSVVRLGTDPSSADMAHVSVELKFAAASKLAGLPSESHLPSL
jgi:hypothetical protein